MRGKKEIGEASDSLYVCAPISELPSPSKISTDYQPCKKNLILKAIRHFLECLIAKSVRESRSKRRFKYFKRHGAFYIRNQEHVANMSRMFFIIVTAANLKENRFLKQIKIPISPDTCALISELPYSISTMTNLT